MGLRERNSFQYDVTLSFAGEDRSLASKLFLLLQGRGISVFYDEFEQANLWGEDLYEYLDDVYSNRARYCIMFISSSYAQKAWTNHERKSAQTRAFRDASDYILPLRLDDTVIPGIRETIGYIDLRTTSIEEVADMVEKKLGRTKGHTKSPVAPAQGVPSATSNLNIPLPNIKKKFWLFQSFRERP